MTLPPGPGSPPTGPPTVAQASPAAAAAAAAGPAEWAAGFPWDADTGLSSATAEASPAAADLGDLGGQLTTLPDLDTAPAAADLGDLGGELTTLPDLDTAISSGQTNAGVEQKIEVGERRRTKTIRVKGERVRFGRRCRNHVRRCMEKEFRGIKMPQVLALLGSLVLPTSDCLSDWAVTISWYQSGDTGWYRAGISIQLINGIISLFVLIPALDKAFGYGGGFCSCRAFLGGLLFGLPGLSPAVSAVLTLYTQNAAEGARQLKWIKMLEA